MENIEPISFSNSYYYNQYGNQGLMRIGSVITVSYPSEQPVNKNLENLETLILFTQASLATLKLFFAGIVKKGNSLNIISLFSLPNARY